MATNTYHIVIADDHHLFAEGLLSMMSHETDYRFTHVSRGDLLIHSLDELQPDLVLLDLKMPGMDGFTALTHLKSKQRNIKVIVLSTYTDAITINRCLSNGADSFLLKNVSVSELKSCIHDVLNNQKTIIRKTVEDISDHERYNIIADTYKITRREWEILQLIKDGFTNQQISERLNLSIYTTETHRKNIMQKLKLKTPVELIKFMLENHL